ncbi:MAG: LeuA family protein [Spirochaetota bacterium]
MRRINVYDTTLRDGEQAPGFTMDSDTKCMLAAELSNLGIDILEAGFPAASQEQYDAVRKIASLSLPLKLSVLARAVPGDIEAAARSLEYASECRIHLIVPSSDILMSGQFHKNRIEILDSACASVVRARQLCDDVQLSLMDATRADTGFLKEISLQGVHAGATVINLADTVGVALPDMIAEVVAELRETIPGRVPLSVHCHNDLGMATANTLSACTAGVNQIECTLGGIGERAGNAALEECVIALQMYRTRYDVHTGVRMQKLFAAVHSLFSAVGREIPYNKPVAGLNAFRHGAGIHQHGIVQRRDTYEPYDPESIGRSASELCIGPHSGIHGLRHRLQSLCVEMDEAAQRRLLDLIKSGAAATAYVSDTQLRELAQAVAVGT